MRLQPGQRREIKGSDQKTYRCKVVAVCVDDDTPYVEVWAKGGREDEWERALILPDFEAHILAHRIQRALDVLPTSK